MATVTMSSSKVYPALVLSVRPALGIGPLQSRRSLEILKRQVAEHFAIRGRLLGTPWFESDGLSECIVGILSWVVAGVCSGRELIVDIGSS